MKIPMKWFSDYTDVNVIPRDFQNAMTMSGTKVEGFEYLGAEIDRVVVGRILEISPHPNADRLLICSVDAGSGPIKIVTGAQNLKPGDLVPVALDGSTLPGGKTIEMSSMRGVMSDGMLCSFAELGLTQNDVPRADPDGILVLGEDCAVGRDIREVLGFDDYLFDFEITSNRPDCLSAVGLAREAAATFKMPFCLKPPAVRGGAGDISAHLSVDIADPALCRRYTARLAKNVKIAPSPAWLRHRLRAAGVRPINNIVDITNYVMLEYGQPMHAFDYSCVGGGRIIVRRARAGEQFSTLDEQMRTLDKDMLVIADTERSIGIAGVMGGLNSEIKECTRTIVFESANFEQTSIRRTSRKLGVRTEASSRFEKGLDPENTLCAVDRACELVELLGAGQIADGVIDVYPEPVKERVIRLEPAKINRLLGTSIPSEEMRRQLISLGFSLSGDDISVPSFRADVEGIHDIAEEVARLYGYDRIPSTLLVSETTQGRRSPAQIFDKRLSEACRALGYFEICTYSMTNPAFFDKLLLPPDSPLRLTTTISNPLGEELSVMRTTMLPSAIDAAARNLSFRNPEIRLFELGSVYLPAVKNGAADLSVLPDEQKVLTLAAYGSVDFYHFKGTVESILNALGVSGLSVAAETDNPSYHPGRCAAIMLSGKRAGVFGQVHPLVCEAFGISSELFVCELNVLAAMTATGAGKKYVPLPKFPAITRDIAVIVGEDVPAHELKRCIEKSIRDNIEKVEFFDIYRGAQIPSGKKSIAFSISLRAAERTLTDEEADDAVSRALEALGASFQAVLRS